MQREREREKGTSGGLREGRKREEGRKNAVDRL
jgi:hypothetical protein